MKAIIKPIRAGKTYELINDYFINSYYILLVKDERRKHKLIDQFNISQKDADRILSWQNAKEKLQGLREQVIVDDIDLFILQNLGKFPLVVTFTGDEAELVPGKKRIRYGGREYQDYYCSACGCFIGKQNNSHKITSNYCASCGAKIVKHE